MSERQSENKAPIGSFSSPICNKHNETMVLSFYDRAGSPPGNSYICRSCARERMVEQSLQIGLRLAELCEAVKGLKYERSTALENNVATLNKFMAGFEDQGLRLNAFAQEIIEDLASMGKRLDEIWSQIGNIEHFMSLATDNMETMAEKLNLRRRARPVKRKRGR